MESGCATLFCWGGEPPDWYNGRKAGPQQTPPRTGREGLHPG